MYGVTCSPLLSYEATFLSYGMVPEVSDELASATASSCKNAYCTILPIKKVHVVSCKADEQAWKYLTTVSITMAYCSLRDHRIDENSLIAHLLTSFYRRRANNAARHLMDSGVPMRNILTLLDESRHREEEVSLSPDYVIKPACEALGILCKTIFGCYGGKVSVWTPEQAMTIGYHMCAIMYYIDAVKDYQDDLRRCNPNILTHLNISREEVLQYVSWKLCHSLRMIMGAVAETNSPTVTQILRLSIPQQFNKATYNLLNGG